MTAKDFVLSKYPNAVCKTKTQLPFKQVLHLIHLNEGGKILCSQPRESWAWANAKRIIIHNEKLAQVKSKV